MGLLPSKFTFLLRNTFAITGNKVVDDNSENFVIVQLKIRKEAVDDEYEEASVTLKSLVTIVRRKLKLGRARARSRAVLLLKALDGHSKAGQESVM